MQDVPAPPPPQAQHQAQQQPGSIGFGLTGASGDKLF